MKRFALLAACLALLGGCTGIQGAIDRFITPSTATLNGYTVERDGAGNPTGNVDLNVSALDGSGEPIDGEITTGAVTVAVKQNPAARTALVPNQVYTGTAEVKFDIELEEVISAVIDIDQSGSMKTTDPARKRVDAAKAFVNRTKEQDRVAVMTFSGESEGLRASTLLQDFTNDKALLGTAIDKVGQRLETPIWDSTLDTLDVHADDPGGIAGASRVVVLFTDGQRNGGTADFSDALAAAQETDVKFFTIGLGAGSKQIDLTELQTLAAATGGTFANVASADELDTLFEKVFNAIRASGVITLEISPTPPAGSLVTGTVEFTVNGRTFNLPYAVQL